MLRRVAAVLSLVCLVGAGAFIGYEAVTEFPRGPIALALVAASAIAGWQGIIRRGASRAVLLAAATILLLGAVWTLVAAGLHLRGMTGVLLLVVSVLLARRVFSAHAHLPPAPPPSHPVVVWNPRSGGGKALAANLADEARRRGIEPIELRPGDDLVALVTDAVARGADGLMAAGGDGTQALVAAIAAAHGLPFACIPAGTRNHFALDLGVDRTDVVGALDAFVAGGEKRVDLGEVNGRIFVNNVSLGLYAEAVQSAGYRDAKIRTILDTVPAVLGPNSDAEGHPLRWTGPDGVPNRSAAVILVSNNVYRLGTILGSGTRPAMDAGVLGVTVIAAAAESGRRRLGGEWATPTFVVESDDEVPVGVDGEALVLAAPLTFTIHPLALRVRIAPHHPGASPSAAMPHGPFDAVRRLVRVAGGADPLTLAGHRVTVEA
jgi:diacylglycerol kinase family enzyme